MEIILKKITTSFFLENHKAENYREIVADLVKPYKTIACNMSLQCIS